jgi:superfamily II DNA or RNA helicase
VDEVHRAGSDQFRAMLGLKSGPRLGLSATPERAGDPGGTNKIFTYFCGIVPPTFTLSDAIQSRVLTPYSYRPYTVTLTDQETEDWQRLTARISQLYARSQGEKDPPIGLSVDSRLKHLLIERARIAKTATGKTPLAVKIVAEHFAPGQRWLVYCDSLAQLNQIRQALRAEGIDSLEYHYQMTGDQQATLLSFEVNGGVLVSVKCLDEGVDIPNATHALILASSRNPREFIQRRGRVLRRAPNKPLAHIIDVLVVPAEEGGGNADPFFVGELVRALEFAQGAIGQTAITDVQRVALRFGVDPSLVGHDATAENLQRAQTGYEDDSEDT